MVLNRDEILALLTQLDGLNWLIASLMYGSGLRVLEALRLRVKDVDLERREVTVREGKGAKDRRTILPDSLVEPLLRQREKVGYDIRTVQELLGHRDVRTTQIYTHILNRGGLAVRSPLDGG